MASGGGDKKDNEPCRKSERKVIPTQNGRQYQITLQIGRYNEVYQCLSELMTVIWEV